MPATADANRGMPDRFTGSKGALYRGTLGGSIVGLGYLVVLAVYLVTSGGDVIDPTRAVYPLVWMTTAGAALAAASVASRQHATPWWALAFGAGYVGFLAWITGQLTPGLTGLGVDLTGGLPGWGPILTAELGVVSIAVVPFQTVGYLVIGILLVRALSVTGGSVFVGVLGLFSCAGCVLPAVAVVTAGSFSVFRGGLPYSVSTIALVGTVVVLVAVVVRGATRGRCSID